MSLGRLRHLRGVGEPVDSFSYPDLRKFGSLEEALNGVDFNMSDLKVLMFDRYDQYAGRFTDAIQRLGLSCIVLIDCKGLTHLRTVNMCRIEYNATVIEVSAGAVCI